ncbi:MAG TPA: GldG family protein, partial [Polyangiaceae bacterium]|nr:GldG family protein [Polyangiaceae bacterium]
AAAAVAVFVNVLVARHYRRYDLTSAGLYTLSEPTKQTLRALAEPVEINVLLSSDDPLLVSVRHLLGAYRSESERLNVRYLDPYKRPAEFLEFQQKYNLVAGRTEDGRVVADATVVVVKGERRWFLTPTDLVDVSEADEGRSRPRLEQGLTTAIRNVLGGEPTRVCVAKGHGEIGLDEPGPQGLGELNHRLERNNVEVKAVDPGAPDAGAEPWKGCDLALVASPRRPYAAAEGAALEAFLRGGGNVFLLLNPVLDPGAGRTVPSGLEPVAAAAGVELRGDLVFEQDKAFRLPNARGEAFFAQAKPHPVTEGLLGDRAGGARTLVLLAQSLAPLPQSPLRPAQLLVTSAEAFARADFLKEAPAGQDVAEKRPEDRPGPLALALAAELPKPPGSAAPRGPRAIVVGTASIAQGQSWQEPALRGGALFVESAVSWLTSRPQIVDIPAKPSVQAGLRLTDDSLRQVTNYVTLYIPAAAALVGLAVYLRRRSTEGRVARAAADGEGGAATRGDEGERGAVAKGDEGQGGAVATGDEGKGGAVAKGDEG